MESFRAGVEWGGGDRGAIAVKKELRERFGGLMQGIGEEALLTRSAEACRLLCETEEYHRAESVMVFLSMPHEVDTTPLVLESWHQGKRVLAPKVVWGERRMIPLEIHSLHQGIMESALNLREPVGGAPASVAEIDLVVVPGLGFDLRGYRLGRGAGFYDRFLAHRDYAATSCALGLEEQILEELPYEPQDRRVDMLVTDRQVRRFTSAAHK